jgi:hypothetical protein
MRQLCKSTPISTTYSVAHVVRLAAIQCPHCRRTLRAHDVSVDDMVRLICGGCHRDLLAIEAIP